MAKKLSLVILLFIYQGYINSAERKKAPDKESAARPGGSYVKLADSCTTSDTRFVGGGAAAPILSDTDKDLEHGGAASGTEPKRWFNRHNARRVLTWGVHLGIVAGVSVACKTVIDLDHDANAARDDLAPLAQLAPYAGQIGAIITNICKKLPELCK